MLCLRNPQDWSDGWQHMVGRQHQSDGLLPRELWPPELETAYSAAAHQPPSKTCLYSVTSAFVCFFLFQFFNPSLLVAHLQIISVGNRAGLIDDAFNLARWDDSLLWYTAVAEVGEVLALFSLSFLLIGSSFTLASRHKSMWTQRMEPGRSVVSASVFLFL